MQRQLLFATFRKLRSSSGCVYRKKLFKTLISTTILFKFYSNSINILFQDHRNR